MLLVISTSQTALCVYPPCVAPLKAPKCHAHVSRGALRQPITLRPVDLSAWVGRFRCYSGYQEANGRLNMVRQTASG
jgi:hypothetical protein